MEIGASSACFYPLETEKSLLHIAELGFRHGEIFFNAPSELQTDFVGELRRVKQAYNMNITSLHAYRSFSEGYDFFSSYKRRYYDCMEKFKRYFEAAAILDAKYIVMHGSKSRIDISLNEYAERFGELNEQAKRFGCSVAHENVVKFIGAKPEFMSFLKRQLGDDFKMVLDVKQARRAGVDPMEFIQAVGSNIAHVHLSDFDEKRDCIPPCEEGLFDFENLFRELHKIGYSGKYIIELYSNGFERENEITESAKYLDKILADVRLGR